MYTVSRPSDQLSAYVKQYWALDNCIPQGREHVQRIVPSGLTEFMFYFGDLPVSEDSTRRITDNSSVSGQICEYYDLKISGNISLFSILFKPHGLSRFFNLPQQEFCNQNIPLRFLFKNDVNELESKLYDAKTFDERVRIVEVFLMKILGKVELKDDFKRMDHCIELISRSRGRMSIEKLADEACLSRKQFERIFTRYIGTSPKKFLNTIRFQNAIDIKSKEKSIDLSSLTYCCGYYDQSHMISDFQRLSGMTPKQYFSECEPLSDFFQYL